MIRHKPKNKLLLLSTMFVVAAGIILLVGASVSWRQHTAPSPASSTEPSHITAEPPPNTEKPKDDMFKNHQVAPDAPRYISIPKISVRAMVKPVGLTAANQIESPRNVFDVGWYNKSAKPGQPGVMVADGHVSSWDTNGVFYELKRIKTDDLITVERGDGAAISYKVVRSQTYDADKIDMEAALSPINPSKPGLNLISCTGKVIKGTNNFDKRLVVFAEQI